MLIFSRGKPSISLSCMLRGCSLLIARGNLRWNEFSGGGKEVVGVCEIYKVLYALIRKSV
jgi:hypothetical protein